MRVEEGVGEVVEPEAEGGKEETSDRGSREPFESMLEKASKEELLRESGRQEHEEEDDGEHPHDAPVGEVSPNGVGPGGKDELEAAQCEAERDVPEEAGGEVPPLGPQRGKGATQPSSRPVSEGEGCQDDGDEDQGDPVEGFGFRTEEEIREVATEVRRPEPGPSDLGEWGPGMVRHAFVPSNPRKGLHPRPCRQFSSSPPLGSTGG